MGGGRGWLVAGGEFFGGRATGAYANVAIGSGNYSQPQGFRFTANCVHGAGRTKRENQDHNIYVNFIGSSGTSGSIDRNVIFDHPNGAGVKLGAGGQPGARGPWNVRVTNNTISNGGRQVLLHGNVRGNVDPGQPARLLDEALPEAAEDHGDLREHADDEDEPDHAQLRLRVGLRRLGPGRSAW